MSNHKKKQTKDGAENVYAKQCFEEKGFCLIKSFFDKSLINDLATQISQTDFEALGCDVYKERVGEKEVVRRIENFYLNAGQLRKLMDNRHYQRLLKIVAGESATLFKEKLNFKSGGGSGFNLHVDGHFFWQSSNTQGLKRGWKEYASHFFNVVIPLKNSTKYNGTLQIAEFSETKKFLGTSWDDITASLDKHGPYLTSEVQKNVNMHMIEMQPGDVFIFDWRCIHGSSKNNSVSDRPILYLTYNPSSQGLHREQYFKDKSGSFAKDAEKTLL